MFLNPYSMQNIETWLLLCSKSESTLNSRKPNAINGFNLCSLGIVLRS